MNLAELTMRFRSLSGHEELTDDEIRFFLNSGQDWIDMQVNSKATFGSHPVDIAADDITATFTRCKSVEAVEIFDADDGRSELEPTTLQNIRDEYAAPLSDLTTGIPVKWAIAALRLSPDTRPKGPEVISNQRFETGSTDWTLGTGWSHDSTEKRMEKTAGSASDLTQASADQANILVDANVYRVVVELTVDAGSITPKLGTTSGTARTESGVYTETITCSGGLDFDLAADASFAGSVDSVSIQEVQVAADISATYDVDAVLADQQDLYNGIVFYPPADETYTLTIFGEWFADEFVGPGDTSWWSVNFPLALIYAAHMIMEAANFKNEEGARVWERRLAPYLDRVPMMRIKEKVAMQSDVGYGLRMRG